MKSIDTVWNGYKFRSRTEARWAVFFTQLGLAWEYELEGFQFKTGERYLPDFYLNDIETWVEVKGSNPNEVEKKKSALLALEDKKPVILVFGVPDGTRQMYYFDVDGKQRGGEFAILEDRRTDGEFWLVSEDEWFSIGPNSGEDHGRYPIMSTKIRAAIDAAKQARFEHGEKPEEKPKRWW